MSSWKELSAEAPDLAASVRRAFDVRKHCTLATLRKDGSPRISGTEVEFEDGEIWLGSMPGALKALDLRRDGRFALHSPTVDPPEENPSAWQGEAKLAGVASEVGEPADGDAHRFRLDLKEAVFTRVDGDQLEIVSWHEGRGVSTHRRS